MEITLTQNIKINCTIGQSAPNATPIVFLHGFTGSSSDWVPLFEKLPGMVQPIAIDIIGHGKSNSPDETEYYKAEQIVRQLNEIFEILKLKDIILVGYSMGGRAALCYAAAHQDKLKALVLESATPGIVNEDERMARIENDNKLADFLRNNSIEVFVDYWANLPIFDSQKTLTVETKQRIRESKLKNSKEGLANSLLGFSTGRMPQLWDKLSKLSTKTLLITGKLDKKFTGINVQMAEKLPNAGHKIIEDAGHNTHLERPKVFLNLLMEFLQEIL